MSAAVELATSVASGDAQGVRRVLTAAKDPKVLLEAKVGLNGATLLHMAAKHAYPDVVEELLTAGADPNVLDAHHDPPYAYVPDDSTDGPATKDVLASRGAVTDKDYFHFAQPKGAGDEQQTNLVSKQLLRNLFISVLLPFLVLLMWNGLYFFLGFVACTAVFYVIAAGYFVTEVTVRPPWYHPTPGEAALTLTRMPDEWRGMVHNPKKNLGLDYEDVEFPTMNGNYMLRGWYLEGTREAATALADDDPMPTTSIVLVHGGGRDRRTWMRHLPMFRRHGYTCLLFDMREHGCSDGGRRGLSFGMDERYDVVAAAQWMKQIKGCERIAVIGTSMGASSAIMAAAVNATHIDVVVAENPLLTCAHLQGEHIHNIMGGYFKHSKWGKFCFGVFLRVCSSWLNLRVNNKPSRRCQSFHVIGKIAPRPVLLMHGTYDSVIPHTHSQKLYGLAKEPKQLWIAPGGFHTGLFDAFPEEFERRVVGFLKKHDKETPTTAAAAAAAAPKKQKKKG